MISTIEFEIDARLRALITKSGMPLKMVSQACGTTNADTLRWWSKDKSVELNHKNIEFFCQFLGITTDVLLSAQQDVPIGLIRERLFTGPQSLPDHYAESASSYVRSSAHIIEFLSLYCGRSFVDRLLTRMNVHPRLYENLDNQINFRFFIDLLNELSRAGLDEDTIEGLSRFVFLRIQDTPLGIKFANARTYAECYAVLAAHATAFDRNFDYQFDIDESFVEIRATPTEAERFLLISDRHACARLFRYKRKLMGWFPTLSDLPPLDMESSLCVSKGDKFTLYRSEWVASTKPKPRLVQILGSPVE